MTYILYEYHLMKDDNHHFLKSFTERPFKFSFEKHYASATMAEVNPVSALLIIIITLFCERSPRPHPCCILNPPLSLAITSSSRWGLLDRWLWC